MNNRIAINPQVCHGQACIQGTRIPVYQILRMLACGDSVEDLLQEYPSITREDILACLGLSLGGQDRVSLRHDYQTEVCRIPCQHADQLHL